MPGLLSASQRADLHAAILEYAVTQNVPVEVLGVLSEAFQTEIPGTTSDLSELEKKWTAIVRLQRKLVAVDRERALLETQLAAAKSSVPSSNSVTPLTPPLSNGATAPKILEGHRGKITSVSFHPKWTMLCSASEDGTIKVWDAETGELERTVHAHTRGVQSIAFSPSGLLVSGSSDRSVKVWDPTHEFANVRTLLGHELAVSAVLATSDSTVVSASRDATIRVWSIESGTCLRVITEAHKEWIRSLSCSPHDPEIVVSAGTDRVPVITNLQTGACTRFSGGHSHVIECVRAAPTAGLEAQGADGSFLFATGGRDNRVIIWNSASPGSPLYELKGHDNWVQDLAWHSNGRLLVSVGDDSKIRVWDIADGGRETEATSAGDAFLSCVAWKDRKMATGSNDFTIRLSQRQ